MSAEATFWAWMMGVKPASCKLVLLCLADCHNSDNGRCDPSTAFISEFTGLDRKTIPEALETLEALGLISQAKRPGNSTQYTLQIADHPAPVREKGARKKVVKFDRPKQLDLARKRATPISGYPNIGLPRNRTATCPENGLPPSPKSGYEPTKNLPKEPTNSSDAAASATRVAKPVDNFETLGEAYRSPSAEQIIFNRGAALLGQHGIADQAARKFLGMCKQQSGAGRTLDAVVVTLLSQPSGDPKAFMLGVLANQPAEISGTWEPDPGVVAELEGLGIPMHMIRNARDAFVVWFSDMEIRHSNWPRLFKDWVIRDWERAEFNAQQYRSNLAKSAGLVYTRPFQEPA